MEVVMTRRSTFVLAAALGVALASPLDAQQTRTPTADEKMPGVVVSKVSVLRATVADIDRANRLITLHTDDGREEIIKAGPEVRNFDQIEKGDRVAAEYHEATAVYARKPEPAAGAPSDSAQRQSTTTYGKAELAPLGQKPGGVITDVTEVTATVQDIDYTKRQVTLRGPSGGTRMINVADDVPNLENVKKGDEVVIRQTQALAISVTK
jgi:hypothetical protein